MQESRKDDCQPAESNQENSMCLGRSKGIGERRHCSYLGEKENHYTANGSVAAARRFLVDFLVESADGQARMVMKTPRHGR